MANNGVCRVLRSCNERGVRKGPRWLFSGLWSAAVEATGMRVAGAAAAAAPVPAPAAESVVD